VLHEPWMSIRIFLSEWIFRFSMGIAWILEPGWLGCVSLTLSLTEILQLGAFCHDVLG